MRRTTKKHKTMKKKARKPPVVKDVVFAETMRRTIRSIHHDIATHQTKIDRLKSELPTMLRRVDMLTELLEIYAAAIKEKEAKK